MNGELSRDSSLDSGAQVLATDSKAAYAFLQDHPEAVLVDVRTKQEWQAIGVPDLSALPQAMPLFLEWITLPEMEVNPDFIPALQTKIPNKATPLLFLCKAGGRSMQAAEVFTKLGYTQCYNVVDGFEGNGPNSGWKQALPSRENSA